MTTDHENQEAAHLEKLRSQLTTDMEAMHQQEASLREYEQRLRLLIEHAHNSRPPLHAAATQYFVTPSADTKTLDAEWEKYNRAHALLEAARRGLCDDRLALKDREERLHAREVEVARREAWVKLREEELTAVQHAQPKVEPEAKPRPTFTQAPFLVARNLFTRQS